MAISLSGSAMRQSWLSGGGPGRYGAAAEPATYEQPPEATSETPRAMGEVNTVILSDLPRGLRAAAGLLRAGQLVAIPTETVYGLAADAFDAAACLRIFAAKRRPAFDPLIVHLRDAGQAAEVVAETPPAAAALMRAFWPGPLTLVLRKRAAGRSGDERARHRGRAPAGAPARAAAARRVPFPLAAPSANLFGAVSPTTARHVVDQLGDAPAYVLDGGACAVGVESTIVGWEDGRCVLYRPGGVPLEALEEVVGRVDPAAPRVQPVSPGTLAAH